jgi:enoyl-CoA hydratase
MSTSSPAVTYDSYKFLKVERQADGILLITLNRPETYNACDGDGHDEMGRIWLDFDNDPAAKVAVITGAGKAFCSGGDLKRADLSDQQHVIATMGRDRAIVHNMMNMRKPVVSAINGVAVGAGLAVALLADISIASEKALLIDGHTKLGVVAGDHAALVWPLLCGLARAKYYLLLCERIDGKEAAAAGMVSRCVPHDELMPTAMAIAARLAKGSQWAIQGTKQVMNNWLRVHTPIFDQSLAMEIASFSLPDAAEGIRAFREKRDPSFPSAVKG